MKTNKFIIALFIAASIVMTGCSSSWLDQQPTGSTITQEQFDDLSNSIQGFVLGMYSYLYDNSSSRHDYFGVKSIDIATDLMSGDMAMVNNSYGWFTDAATVSCAYSTSGRNSYVWTLYYKIIKNANIAISNILSSGELESDTTMQNYYAQALAMRGYCYYTLASMYSYSYVYYEDLGTSLSQVACVPIYTETSSETDAQPLSSVAAVFAQAENDLNTAVAYFKKANIEREDKLYFDKNLANAILAYTYLQDGNDSLAEKTALEVIDSSSYEIMPYDQVLTTGFVDVSDNSWIWGLNVTVDNTGGLQTFWGHVDIHTYSYAYAGAYKAIDADLYTTIPSTDIRKQWFNADKKLVPDWKFYDLERGTTATTIDRDWLNDDVFMRIEEMYLVGAESAYRSGDYTTARRLLKTLLEQRDPTVAAEVDTMDESTLGEEIHYNWRIEMWGEGRSLMTMKRYQSSITWGANHYQYSGQTFTANDANMVFQVPYAETTYNNNIDE